MTAVTFREPPLGLEDLRSSVISEVAGAPGLFTLHSRDVPAFRLFIVDTGLYLPEYAPEITAEHRDLVGGAADNALTLFVIATLAGGAPMVNLLAPILLNPETAEAAQVVLEGDWPLRASLSALAGV